MQSKPSKIVFGPHRGELKAQIKAKHSKVADQERLGHAVHCRRSQTNNNVARVLHLIYRLVVQPNTSRAQTFAEAFISCGGIETLLVLLQREAKAGDTDHPDPSIENDILSSQGSEVYNSNAILQNSQCDDIPGGQEEKELDLHESDLDSFSYSGYSVGISARASIERMASASENPLLKNLGGISFSISADNARNNVYNVDKSDGIVVGIIGLLGALVSSGHLKLGLNAPPDVSSNLTVLHEAGGTMFDDKVSLLLFALQKAFQAAPNRLMTGNVYTALLGASV
ncbi:hypothetical protein U1Q18_023464 [Sarracenia purpurea var. burkii]